MAQWWCRVLTRRSLLLSLSLSLLFAVASVGCDDGGLATNATAATASTSHKQPPPPPPPPPPPQLSCEERYERAVYELRRMRMRACLDNLDTLLRRCAPPSTPTKAVRRDPQHAAAAAANKNNNNQSMRAKASFLRAKVLLLDGDWDAAEAAAAAALEWSAHQQRLADAGAANGGEHLTRALRAAESLLLRVASQRKAHAAAAAHVANKRFEPAFWAATRALKLSWRASQLYLLRARASLALQPTDSAYPRHACQHPP